MMRETADCFLPYADEDTAERNARQLQECLAVRKVFKMEAAGSLSGTAEGLLPTSAVRRMEALTQAGYVLIFLNDKPITLGVNAVERMLDAAVESGAAMVYSDRRIRTAHDGNGGPPSPAAPAKPHPVIDYQEGSVRDDFDFGSVVLLKASLLHNYVAENPRADYKYAGMYDLRLYISRHGELLHLNEMLYTEEEKPRQEGGEKQFDYVDPANRAVQAEMEQAVTSHLRQAGALIDTATLRVPDFKEQEFDCEASVIIPVRNRARTIRDAVGSALSQRTDFKYNVIAIDNHSTDGTREALAEMESGSQGKLIVIIPEREDMGIGGCWNTGVNDRRCGRFAVQLDSDDMYSSPATLQTIVNAFYEQKAAMVVGSYRLCDLSLNTLPPGLVSHAEWTDVNGCNNALRVNGFGAPRAFFTPLLRQRQFPDTSYGEDYAMGLYFSRSYRIGRIFTELYLCRRWGGNSDATPTTEKTNANNLYKDRLRTMEIRARREMLAAGGTAQEEGGELLRFFNRQLETWSLARHNFRELRYAKTRELCTGGVSMTVQFNPARIKSATAKTDSLSVKARKCFLCSSNRPAEQMKKAINGTGLDLIVNPYPILPVHFTLASRTHQPQSIKRCYSHIHRLLDKYPGLTVFYNGPQCGASAPDHLHLQAGTTGLLPLQKAWHRLRGNMTDLYSLGESGKISLVNGLPCRALAIQSHDASSDTALFNRLAEALGTHGEPMLNIVAWRDGNVCVCVFFLRGKHRPGCYYSEGGDKLMISPGALDMAGLLIAARPEDYERLSPEKAAAILSEVSLTEEETLRIAERIKGADKGRLHGKPMPTGKEPTVEVGIVNAKTISFTLDGTFTAKGESVTGRQEAAYSDGEIAWNGNLYRELRFTPACDGASFSLDNVTIGADFHWERKRTETFRGELHLVVDADKIWAINVLEAEKYLTSVICSEMKSTSSPEFLKAHAIISRSWLLAQMKRRRGERADSNGFFTFIKKDDETIRWHDRSDHTLFDVCADDHCQRYQGISACANKHVEEAVRSTRGEILVYDGDICDARFSKCCGGVTEEFQYCWADTPKPYLTSVADTPEGGGAPFCDTHDKRILSQVLNDYDRATDDFYRWTVTYTTAELSSLVRRKLNLDLGEVRELVPLDRGKSGRIWRLKITGSKGSVTIGKELEIRRALSESHLYSSAFDVEKSGDTFILHGKGWGHGVGLCQIGAAVMGERGYKYNEILLHYYKDAKIKKVY